MTIRLELIDLIYILGFLLISTYGFNYVFKLSDKVMDISRRLEIFEGEIVPPDNLVRSIEKLSSQVYHLKFATIDRRGPDSVKNYDLIGRLTHLLLFERIMSLEDLKTMAFSLEPPLNGGIDYTTEQSAARSIVDTMVRQGRWKEVEDYLRDHRPEWEI